MVYDENDENPTRITVHMGEDVTVDVYRGGDPITLNHSDKIADICGFTSYFNTTDYTFTFTSKTHNISHIQIDAYGYNSNKKAKKSN